MFLNSGAQSNYISPALISKLQLPYRDKGDKSYDVFAANNQKFKHNGGTVNTEMFFLDVKIQGKTKKISFNILDIPGFKALLRYAWLRESNP
ncbi:hypothetical protein J3F84DRAFT_355477 [Trichoderma pleuroticola]